MAHVHERPHGANLADLPAAPPRAAVHFADPNDVRAWIDDARSQIADLAAAGLDATRAHRKRVLSRYEARRQIKRARGALATLLDAAARGLDGAKGET